MDSDLLYAVLGVLGVFIVVAAIVWWYKFHLKK